MSKAKWHTFHDVHSYPFGVCFVVCNKDCFIIFIMGAWCPGGMYFDHSQILLLIIFHIYQMVSKSSLFTFLDEI